MARFDVYANPDAQGRSVVPYLLDVQNSYVEVETRVVIPLQVGTKFPGRVRQLNPELSVAGKTLILNTSALGAIPAADLRRPIDNIANQQALIQEALDTLFGGY